jgi:hypothetical protein
MLRALQQVAEAVGARVSADEDETGFARGLHRAEKFSAQLQDLGRNDPAATSAELVPGRHWRTALFANVVTRLIHLALLLVLSAFSPRGFFDATASQLP